MERGQGALRRELEYRTNIIRSPGRGRTVKFAIGTRDKVAGKTAIKTDITNVGNAAETMQRGQRLRPSAPTCRHR